MSAPAFTPGPWEARDGSLHRRHWLIDAPGRRFIAQIDGPPDEEGEANARLIAAAPELYEALQKTRAIIQAERYCLVACATVPPEHDVNTLDPMMKPAIDELDAALADIDAALAKALVQ